MTSKRNRDSLIQALEAARQENDRLQQEVHLLRAQLRRHPGGELQIRQAQRELASLGHPMAAPTCSVASTHRT